MASSSSSSHVRQIKYDVFISFRGLDIRRGFLSHLTKELRLKHIDAYVDERLERGDEISSALLKAIEESTISLIIFSENYASSKWCLEELVKIIECKKVNDQIVIPVFYNINPSDVRHQKGTYEDAFAQHEQKSRYNMDKLQSWRSALNIAGNLSGYDYSSKLENESKLIEKIVEDILKKLDDMCPIESKCLVGFDRQLAGVESLLEIDLSQEVRIVGIWGMGGIGKTTLARAVCDKFSSKFESCCFIESIREESKKINGLSYLLQKLYYGLLGQENINMNDLLKIRSIKRRLYQKKVLVVLDDIDTSEQLNYLVREQLYLGSGSRVIITSRDKHALISGRVHAIHKIKELGFQESLELFSLNAFNQRQPKKDYEELSKEVVDYAKGIPLALKVLGSHLHSRDIKAWESVIRKLKKHPNTEIQNVLKVSYDGLDNIEKWIFLDVAFFLNGEKKDDVIRVLDACNFYADSGIDTLLDKALITISNDNRIQMHDLLQEMGEQIVFEESIKDARRRSRLKGEEACEVLKNNKGSDAIEVITLNLSQTKDVHLSADIFNQMSNLRILKIFSPHGWEGSNVILPFGLKSFPNELRYFHWDRYPLKSLPLTPYAKKLVELCLRDSHVQKLWDGVQELMNLKKIDCSKSKQLMELPDFSKASNLEIVNLMGCESLCSVHPSILSCHTLVSLNLYSCKKLKSLQSEIHNKSLKDLNVSGCYNLKEFSLSSETMTFLYLDLSKIEMLHSSLGRFNKLEELDIDCSTLKRLPINEICCLESLCILCLRNYKEKIEDTELCILFDALPYLKNLDLNGCNYLFEIPDNIGALLWLKYLNLEETGVKTVPANIKHLSMLQEIRLKNCRRLRSLPELPPSVTWLDVTGCTSLQSVQSLSSDETTKEWIFSFQQCVNMDEQSLRTVKEFSHVIMTRAIYNNCYLAQFCYPGSIVPEWFKYKETTKDSFTFELPTTSDYLRGFVCCCVLPQLSFTSAESAAIECLISSEGGKRRICERHFIYLKELNTDHVFLWYCPFTFFAKDESTTYKFQCEFSSIEGSVNWPVNSTSFIKACGVCPIYDSDSEEYWDSDDQEQLPSRKKLKQSCTINEP